MPPRDADKTPRVDPITRKLNYVSPSALKKFDPSEEGGCERRWYLTAVQKEVEESTTNQELGTAVHALHEARVKGEPLPNATPEAMSIFTAMVPYAPTPGAGAFVEIATVNPFLFLDEVPMKGFIDVMTYRDDILTMIDYKTTSNIRYAKTSEQLKTDTQMGLYAAWGLKRYPHLPSVTVEHVIGQTKGKIKADKREAQISLDSLNTLVHNKSQVVVQMKQVALAKDYRDVTPNFNSCDAFNPARKPGGGCPFKKFCTRSITDFFTEEVMALSLPIRGEVESDLKPTTPIPEPVAQVLPPDAPASDPKLASEPLVTEAVYHEEEIKPSRKTRARSQQVDAKSPSEPTKETAPGLRLFLDCFPATGASSLTVYIGNLTGALEKFYSVPDLRAGGHPALEFGKWKGILSAASRKNPPEPGSYFVSTRNNELAQVIAEALAPTCESLVRGI